MAPDNVAIALGRMAQAVAGALELRDVFAGVAESAATVLPFDVMAVGRFGPAGAFTVHAVVGASADLPRTFKVEDQSPAVRVAPGSLARIEDAARELDPHYAFDRMLQERGLASGLRAPLVRGDRLAGAVSVWSKRPGAFTREHEEVIPPIALLPALALEHERLFNLDVERRRRLDAVDLLLPTMAGSLDIRDIFNRISEVVKPILPHDRLVLTSLSADRREITVDAISGKPVSGLPKRMPAKGAYTGEAQPEFILI